MLGISEFAEGRFRLLDASARMTVVWNSRHRASKIVKGTCTDLRHHFSALLRHRRPRAAYKAAVVQTKQPSRLQICSQTLGNSVMLRLTDWTVTMVDRPVNASVAFNRWALLTARINRI